MGPREALFVKLLWPLVYCVHNVCHCTAFEDMIQNLTGKALSPYTIRLDWRPPSKVGVVRYKVTSSVKHSLFVKLAKYKVVVTWNSYFLPYFLVGAVGMKVYKKLSCRGEAARRSVSLKIILSQGHSRSFEIIPLSRLLLSTPHPPRRCRRGGMWRRDVSLPTEGRIWGEGYAPTQKMICIFKPPLATARAA